MVANDTLGAPIRQIPVALIWAQDINGVIGDGRGMLWHVPADLRHFKESTQNSPVLMGRASYEALGSALPHRTNIVITRDRDFIPPDALVAHSIDQGLALAQEEGAKSGAATIWVAGGGQIYRQMIASADELVVSELDLDASKKIGDRDAVMAPQIDPELWEIDDRRSDAQWREPSNGVRWRILVYRRLVRKSTTS